jgi:tRNA U34 5-methylaminomethyl-2-thiouridine-forming methyltransferase MnmC
MKRIIQLTDDGSQTINVTETNITYHSTYGAIQESMHVFINAGLGTLLNTKNELRVFEMGFGTGLNALLTLQEAIQYKQKIHYNTMELFPLNKEIYEQLDYTTQLNSLDLQTYFSKLHTCNWEEDICIHSLFIFHKSITSLIYLSTSKKFDLIYFDAFDPAVQPELWTETIFHKLFNMLLPDGVLTTYSSKGNVRRAMQAAGFTVQKLKGAAGKREMIRAIKK